MGVKKTNEGDAAMITTGMRAGQSWSQKKGDKPVDLSPILSLVDQMDQVVVLV